MPVPDPFQQGRVAVLADDLLVDLAGPVLGDSSLAAYSLPSTRSVSWSIAPSYGSGNTNQTSICRLPVFTNDCVTCTWATWSLNALDFQLLDLVRHRRRRRRGHRPGAEPDALVDINIDQQALGLGQRRQGRKQWQ